MRHLLATTLLLVVCAKPLHAEQNPMHNWTGHEVAAERISDSLVAGAITMQVVNDLRQPEHRWKALGCTGLRLGAAWSASTLIKWQVHKLRPDGSDDNSFPSEHTMTAAVMSRWRYSIGVPFTIGTGGFRMAANKHWPIDTLAGAGIGFAAGLIPCRVN